MFKIGRYASEFTVGEVIEHTTSKTIYESDNNLFSLLTMNHHPVHTNADYASKQRHGKELVVGTLVLSIVVGMTVPEISGLAIANLGYDKVRHLAPTFIGDTLYCRSKVLDIEWSSSGRTAVVHVESIAYNQDKVNILRFERKVLIPEVSDE